MEFVSSLNIYVCRHVYREANRIIDCLAKEGLITLDSSIWWSKFLKHNTNISFYNYYDSLSNCVCKFFVR